MDFNTHLQAQLAHLSSSAVLSRSPSVVSLSRHESRCNSTLSNILATPDDTFHGIDSLLTSLTKSKVSLDTDHREKIWAHIYRMIASPNIDVYLQNSDVEQICQHLLNLAPRPQTIDNWEFQVWKRSVTALTAIFTDDCGSLVLEKFMGNMIKDECYGALLLFLNFGGACYGIDKHIEILMESNNLNSLGIALGLSGGVKNKNLDFDDIAAFLLGELLGDSREKLIFSAACLALIVELGWHGDEIDDVIERLRELNNQGVKIIGKNSRKDNEPLKLALKSIEYAKDESNEELQESQFILDILPLSKSKNVKVDTWQGWFRLNMLKFTFGTSLSSWIAKNDEFLMMLKPNIEFNKFNNAFNSDVNLNSLSDSNIKIPDSTDPFGKKTSAKDRTVAVERGRREKAQQMAWQE